MAQTRSSINTNHEDYQLNTQHLFSIPQEILIGELLPYLDIQSIVNFALTSKTAWRLLQTYCNNDKEKLKYIISTALNPERISEINEAICAIDHYCDQKTHEQTPLLSAKKAAKSKKILSLFTTLLYMAIEVPTIWGMFKMSDEIAAIKKSHPPFFPNTCQLLNNTTFHKPPGCNITGRYDHKKAINAICTLYNETAGCDTQACLGYYSSCYPISSRQGGQIGLIILCVLVFIAYFIFLLMMSNYFDSPDQSELDELKIKILQHTDAEAVAGLQQQVQQTIARYAATDELQTLTIGDAKDNLNNQLETLKALQEKSKTFGSVTSSLSLWNKKYDALNKPKKNKKLIEQMNVTDKEINEKTPLI